MAESLTWKRLPALDLPREAVECFQRGSWNCCNWVPRREGRSRSPGAPKRLPPLERGPRFLGLANALSNKIYPAIDHLELAASLQPERIPTHYTLAQLNFKLRIPQKGQAAVGGYIALCEHAGATQDADPIAQGKNGCSRERTMNCTALGLTNRTVNPDWFLPVHPEGGGHGAPSGRMFAGKNARQRHRCRHAARNPAKAKNK